ncbi:KIR protein [Plasmodium coatneyi]|uniref:KIR protein n=1 Tax=Plasmodium coatneyi TaxID=208452 RepID=A0A1B1E7J9_9APIC|nr:KIR protein [Plasmodium coatneyi]ANQ10920.1 KIR protein [Plasmodium coatneyi]
MAQGVTAEECLDQLPSSVIYKELGSAKDSSTDAPSLWEAGGLLLSLLEDDKVDYVVRAWYLAARKKGEGGDDVEYKKYCNFFYYWIGDMLHSSKKSDSFSMNMGLAYSALNMLGVPNACQEINTTNKVNWSLFQNRKTVFDYYHDYQTIYNNLPPADGDKNWCETKYKDYLNKVSSVYDAATKDCTTTAATNNNTDPCCIKYNEEKSGGNDTKYKDLLEKGCDGAVTKAVPEQLITLERTDSPTTTASTIASSIAAVGGGLAAITSFFLYKYTNLFSGLRGTVSPKRSNRKRRSTNSNFDDTSNDDDTSTYESTNYNDLQRVLNARYHREYIFYRIRKGSK